MASIVIKDLQESTELDRQAMLAIAGGSRFRARTAGSGNVARAGVPRVRLFDPAPGNGTGPGAGPRPR